jgi:GDPmannose 4,6-dehydratase
MKKALICGVSRQDGAYLAQLLLNEGYEVWGTSRDVQMSSFRNLDLNFVGYIPRSLLRFVKTASERVLLSEAEPRSVRGVAK